MAKKESKQRKVTINYAVIAVMFVIIGTVVFYMMTGNSGNGTVKTGDTIDVDYVLRTDDGQVVDTSIQSVATDNKIYSTSRQYSPLEFTVGHGQLIKGFENGVIGMKIGETKKIIVNPEEGYGLPSNDLIVNIETSKINAEGQELQVGGTVFIGSSQSGVITKLENGNATIDFNHPLAGKILNFEITLVKIL